MPAPPSQHLSEKQHPLPRPGRGGRLARGIVGIDTPLAHPCRSWHSASLQPDLAFNPFLLCKAPALSLSPLTGLSSLLSGPCFNLFALPSIEARARNRPPAVSSQRLGWQLPPAQCLQGACDPSVFCGPRPRPPKVAVVSDVVSGFSAIRDQGNTDPPRTPIGHPCSCLGRWLARYPPNAELKATPAGPCFKSKPGQGLIRGVQAEWLGPTLSLVARELHGALWGPQPALSSPRPGPVLPNQLGGSVHECIGYRVAQRKPCPPSLWRPRDARSRPEPGLGGRDAAPSLQPPALPWAPEDGATGLNRGGERCITDWPA